MEATSVAALPPGFKFDPDDDVLVAHYLLPRLRGQPLPFDGIVIEADPLSAPPWKLMDKYGRKDDTFFFADAQARSGNGSRQKRTCAGGGCWEGQKKYGKKVRVPGTGEEIAWQRYALNFHADGEQGSTGWVMHEYTVTAPAELASSSLRAYRIRFSGHGKKRKRDAHDSGGDDDAAGARTAPGRPMAEAALPPLEESIPPTVLVADLVGDKDGADLGASAAPATTTVSDQEESSGMTDYSCFLDLEPLLSVDDVISAAEAAAANLELPEDMDELLQYFSYDY